MYKSLPGLLLLTICLGAANGPAGAQLPATNMGKFVHQPGDNQYLPQTQSERHGAPGPAYSQQVVPQRSAAADSNSSSAYVPTPKVSRPDISLLPIVADEPIKPAGFPPLPDRLDLPVSSGWTKETPWIARSSSPAGSSASRQNLPDISQPTGVHQHYVHYQPGAFQTPQERAQAHPASVDTGSGNFQSASAAPSSHGYYKAADYYSVNTNNNNAAAAAAAATVSGTAQALNQLGREPRLGNDAPVQPDAPTSVSVNQSTTEDLSLQDDEFSKKSPQTQNNAGRQMRRQMVNAGVRTLYTGAIMGASMARVH